MWVRRNTVEKLGDEIHQITPYCYLMDDISTRQLDTWLQESLGPREANQMLCYCGKAFVWKFQGIQKGFVYHTTLKPCYLTTFELLNKDKDPMEFQTFVRKPFDVQALEITKDNIAEVAKSVGDLRTEDSGDPYILVDPRLVPNVIRVYIGFYMTKMGQNVRCYSRRVFREQFTEKTEEMQPWLDYIEGKKDG